MFALLNNDCFQTGAQESIHLKNYTKGVVHLKLKILSAFTLPSCRSKTVLLLCGTQNNVFLRKLATKWFWVPLTSIDKNTMGFNKIKIFQNNIFCLGGLSFNICFYQLLALWNTTRMCSKSPMELEKKNKTLPRNQRSNYRDCSDRRQPGRASNQPQTAILPHTKSSSLISPLISPSSDTLPPPLNLNSAAAASWRSDLLSFRGCWGWSVPLLCWPPESCGSVKAVTESSLGQYLPQRWWENKCWHLSSTGPDSPKSHAL